MGTERGALGGGAGSLTSCVPPVLASKKLGGPGAVGGAGEEARKECGRQSRGGGRGRGRSQAAPAAPDRTRNSSRTEAGETQRETHTQRQRATRGQKEEGAHALGGAAPPPTPGREVGRSQYTKLVPAAFPAPASLLSHLRVRRPAHSRLTWSFSPQSSRRAFWTDARPQARIPRWWKAGGAA